MDSATTWCYRCGRHGTTIADPDGEAITACALHLRDAITILQCRREGLGQ